MRTRMTDLQREWRRANPPTGNREESEHLRWDLKPLLDWFHRPQPRPA
jgi:hypothetical protein